MVALLAMPGLLACSKKNESSQPERTEPWPAPAVSAHEEEAKGARHDYVLESGQKIQFELKTKSTSIAGEFPVVRGSFSLDLMNLKNTEGKLRVDVGAARITSGSDEENSGYSMTAQNWLNVGGSVPEATRERRRWARFLIEEVKHTGATAAHEAGIDHKLTARVRQQAISEQESSGSSTAASPEAGPVKDLRTAPPDRDGSLASPPAEIRVSRARLVGSLELNQRRVTQLFDVELQFYYGAAATPGLPPERIVVKSVRPHKVLLSQHNIEPRDSSGSRIASDLKLIGTEVARAARVSFSLDFVDSELAHSKAR